MPVMPECLTSCLLFIASRLLITFANSLDLDQDQHSVGPDLDPNRLTLQMIASAPEIIFLKKVSRRQQKHEILPSMQRVKVSSLMSG